MQIQCVDAAGSRFLPNRREIKVERWAAAHWPRWAPLDPKPTACCPLPGRFARCMTVPICLVFITSEGGAGTAARRWASWWPSWASASPLLLRSLCLCMRLPRSAADLPRWAPLLENEKARAPCWQDCWDRCWKARCWPDEEHEPKKRCFRWAVRPAPEVLHWLRRAPGNKQEKAMLKVSKILIDRQENPAALSEPTPYLGATLEVTTARTATRPLTGFVSGTA